MIQNLQPLRTESLKGLFVARFEELILSGKIKIGEKLPPERDLALQLGVSRPVVHEGLVDLAAKGLVTMKPRVGAVVNDYRKDGSLALLTSLVNHYRGDMEPGLMQSLLDMRALFETETARLAARHRTAGQLGEMKDLLARETALGPGTAPGDLADLDFQLHHLTAMASGNHFYPLVLNSFRDVYHQLADRFYSNPAAALVVFEFHRDLVAAVERRDETAAAAVMERLLDHGRQVLGLMD